MRRLLLFLIGTGLVVGLLCIAALQWIETDSGRAFVRDRVVSAIGGGMAGSFDIERIEELSLNRVHARGVTFRDPTGKPAIEVTEAVVDFELSQLWSGPYGFSRADIDGCRVHVTEDEQGKINIQRTFASKKKPDEGDDAPKKNDGREIDLRSMITSGCTLVVGGGSLPSLRMTELEGIMRVHIASDGKVALRFEGYDGTFEKGLPTGVLKFREVAGHVEPGEAKLLHFDGKGRSEGAPVEFVLDILTKPKTRVKIDATFPELSANGLRAMAVAGFSKFSDTLEFDVHHGRQND